MTGIIVHEWLAPTGGSENVFEDLGDIFPDAQRWCLWNDSNGRFPGVAETWLARTPIRRSKALAVPFAPLAWRTLPERDADWVLCSSHLFAHHARFRGAAGDAPKLVYAYTPARYIWVPELDGRGNGPLARGVSSLLKPLDRRRAREPHAIASISEFVAERVRNTWERESDVIYPPVDVTAFAGAPNDLDAESEALLAGIPAEFVLGVSRFVPYKQLDKVIDTGAATGLPVVLAGSGPDEDRLRAHAAASGAHVIFIESPSFTVLRELYRRATVFVFAPVEDFGIVPVEAMASGTPVIANAVGGAAETVRAGVTGAHVQEWDAASLRDAFDIATSAHAEDCRARAAEFDVSVFATRIRDWVQQRAAEAGGAR